MKKSMKNLTLSICVVLGLSACGESPREVVYNQLIADPNNGTVVGQVINLEQKRFIQLSFVEFEEGFSPAPITGTVTCDLVDVLLKNEDRLVDVHVVSNCSLKSLSMDVFEGVPLVCFGSESPLLGIKNNLKLTEAGEIAKKEQC